jgi:hypothetical protein
MCCEDGVCARDSAGWIKWGKIRVERCCGNGSCARTFLRGNKWGYRVMQHWWLRQNDSVGDEVGF